MEFFLRPEEEFLSSMAQEAVSTVFKYFKNQEKQAQQIIKY